MWVPLHVVTRWLISQNNSGGHGSIDDPDGTVIYEQTHATIHRNEYASIYADIIVARLPPSDQLLDLILSNAQVALQLSHREGFEVKVTEALAKGIPVVAYQAGGIPLQIKKDVNGFLVPIGDVQGVADKLFSLVTDPDLRAKMSEEATANVTEEFLTVYNAINWLHLFIELTNDAGKDGNGKGLLDEDGTYALNSGVGDNRKVCDLWREKYKYDP